MNEDADQKLNQLLQEAYPTVEVSSDFTLQLWRKLIKQPVENLWRIPVPVAGLAAAVGIFAGVLSWVALPSLQADASAASQFAQVARWDLFGNAPLGSLSGSTLTFYQES